MARSSSGFEVASAGSGGFAVEGVASDGGGEGSFFQELFFCMGVRVRGFWDVEQEVA